jgi:hypothetical protein
LVVSELEPELLPELLGLPLVGDVLDVSLEPLEPVLPAMPLGLPLLGVLGVAVSDAPASARVARDGMAPARPCGSVALGLGPAPLLSLQAPTVAIRPAAEAKVIHLRRVI